jgi:LPS-assembly lipoprotein
MWWRNNRVALGHALRTSAVIAIAGLNAACFQPLYASKSVNGGPSVGTALAQVRVERIDAPNGTPESRVAGELESALDFELQGGGGIISPTHALKVRMTANRQSIITDPLTGRLVSEITGVDVSFTLTELATGKSVMTGRAFSRVSSEYPGQQQRFARVRARIDAETRAAKTVAESIRTRVASYFVAGT